MSVVKTQVTICPYMNFGEGIVLTRFTTGPSPRFRSGGDKNHKGGQIF